MSLTQEMLNVDMREKAYLDVLMMVQDKNIKITNVTSDDILSFSNLQSIIDPDKYSSTSMATLENELWLLNGAFFNPNQGQKYDGYTSNSMSDDNGDFITNPKIDITLLQEYDTEYLSLIYNSAIDSSYPKQTIVRLKNNNGEVIKEIVKNTDEIDTMPNYIIEANMSNVKSVQIELVGTKIPHRRARLSTFIFGKLEPFTQDVIEKTDWIDKTSLVADSLPTRTFDFTVFNYDKRYNIDNPSNELPVLNRNTEILMRWGYETNGLIEWTEMKHLRLASVLTNTNNTVTFQSGSILDILDMVYDRDIYNGPRTVGTVVHQLLSFAGISSDTVTYDSNFASAIIDRPLPEQSVRELIQLCAFSCGATLQILDNGKIRFAELNLNNIQASYTYNDFASIPRAEQLAYTYDIALTKNTSVVDINESQLVKQTVTTFQASISYPAAQSPYIKSIIGGTVVNAQFYATHCELELNFTGDSCEIEIYGNKIETTTNYKKSATSSTLILDSKLAANPSDDITSKYANWYAKKFKYLMDTRGEPLRSASDIINIQSPFSEINKEEVTGYLLQNELSFDGAWSGKMEVIVL